MREQKMLRSSVIYHHQSSGFFTHQLEPDEVDGTEEIWENGDAKIVSSKQFNHQIKKDLTKAVIDLANRKRAAESPARHESLQVAPPAVLNEIYMEAIPEKASKGAVFY